MTVPANRRNEMNGCIAVVIVPFLSLSAVLCGQAQETGSVQVATMAPNNRTVAVYYQVPKDYDAARRESYGRGSLAEAQRRGEAEPSLWWSPCGNIQHEDS